MKCQYCSNPATVHLTDIVNKQKRELHLCQECAEKHQLIQQHQLNLPAILHAMIGQYVGAMSDELARLACPACGMRYMEFRAEGRLGCPHDYNVFRVGLGPLLERIHRASRHVGKVPRHRVDVGRQVELVELRQKLRRAIEAEAYEEAAQVRDLIRQKEATG
ncbi:MAG: UvrB/UvrC motif-containing protein [Gemmataceae bacterium]|nr:UvrB/UvrC motif-containing protein [Gemmataceae bacterium]MDW8265510.1 UvrB/UvrC motif-containing protein [Gemmataceae bacterium]